MIFRDVISRLVFYGCTILWFYMTFNNALITAVLCIILTLTILFELLLNKISSWYDNDEVTVCHINPKHKEDSLIVKPVEKSLVRLPLNIGTKSAKEKNSQTKLDVKRNDNQYTCSGCGEVFTLPNLMRSGKSQIAFDMAKYIIEMHNCPGKTIIAEID